MIGRAPVTAALLLLTMSCSASGSGPQATPTDSSCLGGIYWFGKHYTEVDVGSFSREEEITVEGQYPECHSVDPAGGFATDVYRLDGVPTSTAVVGLRRGTHRYVVFARTGTSLQRLRALVARTR